jgi:Domain of unknown function (DUF4160)
MSPAVERNTKRFFADAQQSAVSNEFFSVPARAHMGSPSHFHAEYGEYEAKISIETLEILDGRLPNRALGLVLEWAALHRIELRQDWELSRNKKQPKKIVPLE